VELNDISPAIIGAACRVHTALGPGLLEHAYQVCLKHELNKTGLKALSEVGLPIADDGTTIEIGYRLDLLVEDTVIVELKAVEHVAPIHRVQLLTYLKLSGKPLGLLLNFNVVSLREGITRISIQANPLTL
jgi:GxxExxY protein